MGSSRSTGIVLSELLSSMTARARTPGTLSVRRQHVFAACAAVLVAVILAGCSVDKSRVLTDGVTDEVGAARLARRARAEFDAVPRTTPSVAAAHELMRAAAQSTTPPDTARYGYLTDAARYAIWLMSRSDTLLNSLAEETVVFCNTAIRSDSSKAAAYYYRAITIGLIARKDKLKGRSAMRDIRDDCRQAIAIDPALDHGGPHRVLGALYLRAPGPPAGVGSLRQAISHLEESVAVAPEYPENRLFLAEAYLEAGRADEAAALLDTVEIQLSDPSVPADDRSRWLERMSVLREMQAPAAE